MQQECQYSSWVLEGAILGDVIRLRFGNSMIGRSKQLPIRLRDTNISRIHAEIRVSSDDQNVQIADLNSVNGVYINDQIVRNTQADLKKNDRIGIGVFVDENAQVVNPDHAVYILKYKPIRCRIRNNGNSINHQGGIAIAKAAVKLEAQDVITLSDDDDENDVKPAISTKPSTSKVVPAIAEDKVKIISVVSLPAKNENKQDDTTKSGLQSEVVDENCSGSSSCSGKLRADDDKDANILPVSKVHVPVMSMVKKETICTMSNNIEEIFGELNEDCLDTIKKINVNVFGNLHDKSNCVLSPRKGVLMSGDQVDLVSDDDDDEENVGKQSNGQRGNAENDDKDMCVKSPNILDTSMDNSKEKERLNDDADQALLKGDENSNDEDEEAEDIMFSQYVLNEMKSELAQDDDNNTDNESFEFNYDVEDKSSNISSVIKIKSEPLTLPGEFDDIEEAKEINNSVCWIISDDEDVDEDLETKVSGWSTKLYSQNNVLANMSQVYELPDEDEKEAMSDFNKASNLQEYNSMYEHADDCEDIYNRDDKHIMDEMFQDLKCKLSKPLANDTIDSRKTLETEAVAIEDIDKESLNQEAKESLLASSDEERDKEATTSKKFFDSPIVRQRKKSLQRLSSTSDEEPVKEMKRKSMPKLKQTKEFQIDEVAGEKRAIEEDTDFITSIEKSKENLFKPSTLKETKLKSTKPFVIDAPHLPQHKGKLRGVSAESPSRSALVKNLHSKTANVRASIQHQNNVAMLKQKWHEKPNAAKKRKKEETKAIKDARKERLKDLANHQQQQEEAKSKDIKRKSNITEDSATVSKKAKVKITPKNRGAFLADDAQQPPPPSKSYKIPKMPNNVANACDTSNDQSNEKPFDQVMSSLDAQKKMRLKKCTDNSNVKTNQERTEAAMARAQRTTNKITFASMEKNFVESDQNQKKLEILASGKSSCLRHISLDANETSDSGVELSKEKRKNKTVRFNEIPTVHYIERVYGAVRKVDRKDLMPQPWYSDRRDATGKTYPILDFTDHIISQILHWSNEWLIKRNVAAVDVVYPMPQNFTSYDHYKNIIFPLMKLEFVEMLKREYLAAKKHKPLKVNLEQVSDNKRRLILMTKYNAKEASNKVLKCDLVLLEFGSSGVGTFAYASAHRKPLGGACGTIVFEIVKQSVSKELLRATKELTVRQAMESVRVEFGAINAVYQLEKTPLFNQILNPLELLKPKPVTKPIAYKGYHPMNACQNKVLFNTYNRLIDDTTPNITLIKGPPGTGKSRMVINLALQLLYGNEVHCLDRKVLICAQSNAAVDLISEKLMKIRQKMRPEISFNIVRFGILDKVSPEVAPITLQKMLERDQLKRLQDKDPKIQRTDKEYLQEQIKLLEIQVEEFRGHIVKGTVQEDELVEKQRQLQLMRNIANQYTRPEDERSIYRWYLKNANIVCTTLSGCVKLSQYIDYFDACIIDEATQCTEPWTLLPLKFGIKSLVLVGDTQQLPATVLSKKALDLGLGTSMFTRIQRCLEQADANEDIKSNVICGLTTQYRMHPEICKWPNAYFYNNTLVDDSLTQQFKSDIVPFSILNLVYTQNAGCSSGQIVNNCEARFVVKLLQVLDRYLPTKHNSYGVITPYAQHRNTLAAAVKSVGLTNIMVNTIDSYQGIEKDVIIISNARTNGIGFLCNYQRLNVALTRPRKCLILCGNFKSLECVPVWRNLLNNARERKLYHELSEDCANKVHTEVIDKIKVKRS